tara:strand:- start:303 stop:632 length:330 start_codon:yes stop_codon:yes gene_type:complete
MWDKLDLLDSGKYGYVAYCNDCGLFNVAFGTTVVTLNHDEVQFILSRVSHNLNVHENRVCPKAKAFMFRLSNDNTCQLVLTYGEMQALHDLLTNSLLVYEVKCVLNADI